MSDGERRGIRLSARDLRTRHCGIRKDLECDGDQRQHKDDSHSFHGTDCLLGMRPNRAGDGWNLVARPQPSGPPSSMAAMGSVPPQSINAYKAGGASRVVGRSSKEMKWAKDPRVLVCIIAALIFVIWMVLQQQYYWQILNCRSGNNVLGRIAVISSRASLLSSAPPMQRFTSTERRG